MEIEVIAVRLVTLTDDEHWSAEQRNLLEVMKLRRDMLKLDFLSHISTLPFRRPESNIDLLAVKADLR